MKARESVRSLIFGMLVEKKLTLIKVRGLNCHAVHSGKAMATDELALYTGSKERVYNYDRNGEFAAAVKKVAEKPSEEECKGATNAPATLKSVDEPTYSAKPKAQDLPDDNESIKDSDGVKVSICSGYMNRVMDKIKK